jgi:hypothetical protein
VLFLWGVWQIHVDKWLSDELAFREASECCDDFVDVSKVVGDIGIETEAPSVIRVA